LSIYRDSIPSNFIETHIDEGEISNELDIIISSLVLKGFLMNLQDGNYQVNPLYRDSLEEELKKLD
jgi:predicted transcriptional regulator of viral defense system